MLPDFYFRPASWILPPLEPGAWVHLVALPSAFSDDEALLICQWSDHEWIAWIPDHGETLLDTDQFLRLTQ